MAQDSHAKKPKVVGIIPARYGSTRLPGKALRLIAGKPMIQRVLERCLTARRLDSVWVATDDERIAQAVAAVGGRVIMTSPRHPSGTDRLAEAVTKLEADIVVNLQGDQPFLDAEMIEEAVQPLLDDPGLPMATIMHPVARPEDFANPSPEPRRRRRCASASSAGGDATPCVRSGGKTPPWRLTSACNFSSSRRRIHSQPSNSTSNSMSRSE